MKPSRVVSQLFIVFVICADCLSSAQPAISSVSPMESLDKQDTSMKLKRVLTNFLNHRNPAPYFVPLDAVKMAPSSPQTASLSRPKRPAGSPLRWGRRR